MRLKDKIAIVVGAGQTPGETIGNGRATAVLFARQGATVVAVDKNLEAAEATVDQVTKEGGRAQGVAADVTDEGQVAAMIHDCLAAHGRIDILHNNVGVSLAAGDAPAIDVTADAFDRVVALNLKTAFLTSKHVLPAMRDQRSGVIIYISSLAAITDYPNVGYKTSKAGVVALMEHVAIRNAPWGIRANAILPGLMNTPMAIENRVGRDGMTREQVIASRDARVPLHAKMGTAWDVAHAAVFLASDEAGFITGAALRVDGGQALNVSG